MDIMESFTEKTFLFLKIYIIEFLQQPFLITKMFT